MLMASVATDAFFLRRERGKEAEAYHLALGRNFESKWAEDVENDYQGLFENKRGKVVKFFRHWVPEAGYSGRGAGNRTSAREEEMLQSLSLEVENNMDLDLADVLFVPYHWYAKGGLQFGEPFYHFVAGLILRDAGYLILDEYTPSLITGTARTPDLSAFRTPELVDVMKRLRAAGVISSGAFAQELQLRNVLGSPDEVTTPRQAESTDAEIIAVEVKRNESQYMVKRGSEQLRDYLLSAYGFYDEGYLSGPSITGPGTISIGDDGSVRVERPSPSTSAAITDFWRERKSRQLLDVRVNVMLQILKCFGLSEMVEVCGGKGSVRTYDDLVRVVSRLDVGDLLKGL